MSGGKDIDRDLVEDEVRDEDELIVSDLELPEQAEVNNILAEDYQLRLPRRPMAMAASARAKSGSCRGVSSAVDAGGWGR